MNKKWPYILSETPSPNLRNLHIIDQIYGHFIFHIQIWHEEL